MLVRKLKRDTQLIIISVLILTLSTMSVSYSAFFSVQSQSTIQEITTGTLDVIIDTTNSTQMSTDDLFPTAEADLPTSASAAATGSYANLILQNNGTLHADFSVSVSYDSIPNDYTEEDLISFDYLVVGIYDTATSQWVNFSDIEGEEIYYTSFSALTPSGTNTYPILRSIINKNSSKEYRVYIWLSESTPTTEIGKIVYLKLDVKSTPVNGQSES